MTRQRRNAFGYFGSKDRLGTKILDHMPPHACWVEAYAGSAAITMAKEPAPIEIINDTDGDVVNALRMLRDDPEHLIELIELTPYARAELRTAREATRVDLPPSERARRFLVRAMMAVNGAQGSKRGGFSRSDSYARESTEARVNRWRRYPERLRRVIERLRRVRIEERNAIDLLREHSNRPGSLVYLDPPYLGERAEGYADETGGSQAHHTTLLGHARTSKCMIMLSANAHPLYEKALGQKRSWHRIDLDSSTRGTAGGARNRVEHLWLNGPATRALKRGKPDLELSASERAQGKINPTR